MGDGGIAFYFPDELRWLLQRIRPFLHLHLSSFVCITAASIFGLLTPLVLKWIIDRIVPQGRASLLFFAMALIFLGSQGKTAVTSLGSYLQMLGAQRMSLKLRMELLLHLDSLCADYHDVTPLGEISYPFREPIEEVAYFASELVPAILRTALTTGFTLAAMFALSPALTLLVVPFIPVFLILRNHFRKKLTAHSDSSQYDRLSWNNFLEEHIAAAIPIQLLGQTRRQQRRAFQLLGRAARSQVKVFRTAVWFGLSTSFAIVLSMATVIGYGGWSVIRGALTLGSLIAFYSFVMQLFDPLAGAAELYSRAQKTFASVRQIQRFLAIPPSMADHLGSSEISSNAASQIELSGVEFGYARQKRMLRVRFLQITSGERLAISGDNGAGKSTLAKLIARIYDVDCGSVRIAGQDVRDVRIASLRRYICYLSREPILFEGTVASNLRFVNLSASDSKLLRVIERAGLSEFVAGLPHGLRQSIGPAACQLSGGQRQRLAIARALLQGPKILILDEATSCIDVTSEGLVLENVYRYLEGSTIIVISHRQSATRGLGRNIVMSAGEIVADTRNGTVFSKRLDCCARDDL